MKNRLKRNSLYIKNIFILFLDNILKLVVGFLFSVFIARYFGPGRFGHINYVVAFISILQILVAFGIDDVLIKDIGFGEYPEDIMMGTAFKCRLILAAIVYSIGCLVFFFVFDKSGIHLYLLLGLQLFVYSLTGIKTWFQIKSLNQFNVIAAQMSLLLVSCAKIFLLLFKKGTLLYTGILLCGIVVDYLLLLFFYCKKSSCGFLKKFDFSYCKKLLAASAPLLLQNFTIVITLKTDQLMIGKMLSSKELGIYSIGVTVSELVYFVPMAVLNGIMPKIIKEMKENRSESLLIKMGSVNFIICFIYAICVNLLAPFFVRLLYGEAYIDAGRIIQIHSWAGLFVAIGISHTCFLIFKNIQKYSLYASIFGAGVNIILNYFFIRSYGINGAAIATVISTFFSGYACFAFFKDKRSFVLRTKSLLFKFR
jgi:PST family polysaccharide transporter